MKSKTWLVTSIVIGIIILAISLIMVYLHTVRTSPSSSSSVASTTYTKGSSIKTNEYAHQPQLPANTTVMQSLQQDLYNDGQTESLVLYVQDDGHGTPIFLNLTVNGVKKVAIAMNDLMNGYGFASHDYLEFKTLEPGRVPDVLLYLCGDGSAGAELLYVYRPSKNVWERVLATPAIPDSEFSRYSVKYIGNYQVSFFDKATGLQSVIDLDRATHQNVNLNMISNWVDPVSDYEFSNTNSNEAAEIIAIQRVIGISHPDTIAELRITYQLENGQYEPVAESLTTPRDYEGKAVRVLSEIHF